MMALNIDIQFLTSIQSKETTDYLKYNEWGLAYDVLAFGITHENYKLSRAAEDLIRQAAAEMGIEYPNMSS